MKHRGEIERAINGMCIRDKQNLYRVMGCGVTADYFELPSMRAIFEAIVSCEQSGVEPDLPSVGLLLKGELMTVLVDVTECCPVGQNVDFFARELIALRWQQNMALKLSQMSKQVMDRQAYQEVAALQAQIVSTVMDLGHDVGSTTPEPSETIAKLLEEMEASIIRSRDGKSVGIPSGLKAIDNAMGGFHPRSLTVVAARTSVGKTTFGCNVAFNAASQGVPVLYFSNEMNDREIAVKVLSRLSRIPASSFRSGDLTDEQCDRLTHGAGEYMKLPLRVNHKSGRRLDTMLSTIKGMHKQGKCGMVIVDYIQQVKAPGRWDSRHSELGEISGRLKSLALDLDIPVIALAQINREGARGDEAPKAHHIKDSGAIEQDADTVMILHREPIGTYLLNIEKNRHGFIGSTSITADLQFNLFADK